MKHTKKLFALLLAVLIIAALAVPALAEGEGKTITLTGGKAGHTYTLYQIFTGKVEGGELTGIQWGADASDIYKSVFPTAASAAREIALLGDARHSAQNMIDMEYLGTGTPQTLSTDGNVVFSGLAEGYYVIVDTNNNTTPVEGDYSSALIVELVEDVTGELKGNAPTSEKKVDDKNDSDTSEDKTEWQDSADYDIGDAVPFQLKATTADNVSSYKKYHVTFQDDYSEGLDAPTSFTVTVLGKSFTLSATDDAPAAQTTDNETKISVAMDTADSGQDFAIKVTFEPTVESAYLDAECNNAEILVNYTQVLNENAKIGAEGNPNTSYIKYSSNPESKDDSEEGKTPADKVIVFTYKTVIDKIDETGAALKGADFTLYKQVAEGTTDAVKGSEIEFADGVEHTAISADKYYVVVGHKTGDAKGSTFEFKGIDDGVYVLVETTIPSGYNAWKSAEVTISAKHDVTADNPTLTELTATSPFTATSTDGSVEATKKDGTKHTVTAGEAYAEIENNSGAVLPSTGGIGTTIFYVVGGIMVAAALVLLITKKRVNEEN